MNLRVCGSKANAQFLTLLFTMAALFYNTGAVQSWKMEDGMELTAVHWSSQAQELLATWVSRSTQSFKDEKLRKDEVE